MLYTIFREHRIYPFRMFRRYRSSAEPFRTPARPPSNFAQIEMIFEMAGVSLLGQIREMGKSRFLLSHN